MANEDRLTAWIVHMDTTRIRRNAVTINRWWSGMGDLTFEGHVWRGAARSGNPRETFMAVSDVVWTRDAPGRRATVSWAVLPEHARHAVAVDLGGIGVDIGWIVRPPYGTWPPVAERPSWLTVDASGWARGPASHEGVVGESNLHDGYFSIEVETEFGDIDRGIPLYWSHETAEEGDLYAEMAEHIARQPEIDWPLNVVTGQGQRRLAAGNTGLFGGA